MEAPNDGASPIKNEASDATMADQTPQLPSPKRRRSSSADSLDETEKDAARRYAAKRIKPETNSEVNSTVNNGANSEAHSGGNGEIDAPATVKQATTATIERHGERVEDAKIDFDMTAIIAATTQQIVASAAQASPTPTQSGFGQLPQAEPCSATHIFDPYHVMRIESLPVLGNLSTLLLSKLAQGPYDETIRMVTKPESDVGQAYVALKGLFDQTKKMYIQTELPFISADKLGIQESTHRATIRTTNIATFVSSIFGGGEIGFYDLNDHFIETFTPDGEELQKEVTHLYLNFKTQMYLTAMSSGDSSEKEETLASLFPDDLRKSLALRHPSKPLSQSENEFINLIVGRRQFLLNEPSDSDSIAALTRRFEWEDFLQSLSRYLSRNYAPLLDEYRKRHALTVPAPPAKLYETNGSASVYGQSHQASAQSYGRPGDPYWSSQPQNNGGISLHAQQTQQTNGQSPVDVALEAKRAADEVLRSLGFGGAPPSPPQHNGVLQYPVFPQNITNGPGPNASGLAQYDKQPASTVALYRKARQSVHAKTSPTKGRPGVSNQARRPWTDEELIALLAGLDAVQGPHWSQIIALHGPGGSLSSALKDRNQVQLKDKARNLKLFFLKENIEVPYYLTFVTGDLKSRAPSLAAKKESEERARLASDEERAKFNGVMSLAGQPGYGQSLKGAYSSEGELGTNSGERSNVVEPQTNIRRDSNSQAQFQPPAQQQQSYFQSPYTTQPPTQQKQVQSTQPLDTNEQLLMQHLMPFNADNQAADGNNPNAQSKAG